MVVVVVVAADIVMVLIHLLLLPFCRLVHANMRVMLLLPAPRYSALLAAAEGILLAHNCRQTPFFLGLLFRCSTLAFLVTTGMYILDARIRVHTNTPRVDVRRLCSSLFSRRKTPHQIRSNGHRYHTHVLRGQSDGRWFFHTMEEFLDKHYSPNALLSY